MAPAVDTKTAATLTGLAEGTLNNLRTLGGGPRFMKLGRAVRYRVTDLNDWMVARTVTSTSERVAA